MIRIFDFDFSLSDSCAKAKPVGKMNLTLFSDRLVVTLGGSKWRFIAACEHAVQASR
jgi:hypothetical protein